MFLPMLQIERNLSTRLCSTGCFSPLEVGYNCCHSFVCRTVLFAEVQMVLVDLNVSEKGSWQCKPRSDATECSVWSGATLCALNTELSVSHVTRKPVFGVCDQLRLKPACSADETGLGLEILAIASRGIILLRQQTTKVLIRLRLCCSHMA